MSASKDLATSESITSPRAAAKEQRRADLLTSAARLFAQRGYAGVSLDDLGQAVGVSGPAVYRHFAGKPAVLAALLVGVSEGLLAGARRVAADSQEPRGTLGALIDFHVDFALDNHDVIRVQDRELQHLADSDRRRVRTLQREYVSIWVAQLGRIEPDASPAALAYRAHAAFGLINSTSHSVRARMARAEREVARVALREMTWWALLREAPRG
ncbi:TetR/AcrR family transcriptional regulator [Micrococcales bacterium 31B]|nr:TetR/AcrR family transcriptional regulator [Micrococcales bacterium 31B]